MRVTEGALGVPVHSRVTPHAPAPLLSHAKAGSKKDRYVILSPHLLELLREWWRAARKKGWMSPGKPWLFPGTAGSIRVRASSTGLFTWPRGVPALPNVSAFTHCGAALPRICWSRRPISGSSGACPSAGWGSARTQKLDTTALYTRGTISALGQVTSPLDFLLKMPG
jgi:integrase/recombinase XerD